MAPKPPADLDSVARKKFREMIDAVDPAIDEELVANYARMYSSLMAIRAERGRQMKAGTYEALVPGRDKTLTLNPLQVAENRMVVTLNRMLRTLGLAPSREEQSRRRPVLDNEEIDGMEAALIWPYGRKQIEIWRQLRRGKVEFPTNPAERLEWEKDQAEADGRLADWKASVGIVDDGDGPIQAPAPGLGTSYEQMTEYNAAKDAQRNKIEAAIRRAGLDPHKL